MAIVAAMGWDPGSAGAQTATNLPALRGLAPISALRNSEAGKAALAANLRITAAIQSGMLKQPILLPFADQQRQALRDAFITQWNASELADGLGSTLGAAYQVRASYRAPKDFTNISTAVADVIAYANETTEADSRSAKYFFGNKTTDGKMRVSSEAMAILSADHGTGDVFGKAYRLRAGSVGADPYGNSRPFQTEPAIAPISGADYFGRPADNTQYLKGPAQNLTASPAYPSGHTTYGYVEAVLLAILVPERYQQEITRAAEYGNDRIVLGAHYAMDVIAGRTLALYDLAHLLANDPSYVGQPRRHASTITDYDQAVAQARKTMTAVLEAVCGDTVGACARKDNGRFRDVAANEAFVESTLTYGLPVVNAGTADGQEDVFKVAPEAGHLLTAAFPTLALDQADALLTATEGPGGGFLDDGSGFGIYSRLNLAAAATRAAALAPTR